jgi:diguanylate cyclase (GGDEF)-like protein
MDRDDHRERRSFGRVDRVRSDDLTDFPIQEILNHLVKRIVGVLPVTAAGVTLISPGANPRYVAASNGSALRFEQLQSELGEGPCAAAYDSGEAVSMPDLRTDDRFPTFSSQAAHAGLLAVFTFPLNHGDERLGALDLYRDEPGPLSADAMRAAQTLADVAAAYVLNAQARIELRDVADRSIKAALHDSLTGLPNRALMAQRIEHALLRRRRSHTIMAVLFVDLDGFKAVNDAHGHRAGDKLLVAVAERLRSVLRPGDTLARQSGDEFVILCEDLGRSSQADAIADRVHAALAAPLGISGLELTLTAQVGIALTGRGNDSPEALIHAADLAMYRAKGERAAWRRSQRDPPS